LGKTDRHCPSALLMGVNHSNVVTASQSLRGSVCGMV